MIAHDAGAKWAGTQGFGKLTRRRMLAATLPLLLAAKQLTPSRLATPPAELWDPAVGPLIEGTAEGPNGAVYYRRYGDAGRTPIVVLHGGPVAGHRTLLCYAALARDKRQVVLYDQSGSGRSARPSSLELYTVERYVAELEALRAHLGFEQMILVGHNWGGMLAPAYATAHPNRVKAMSLAGTVPRWLDYQEAANRWLQEMGPAAVRTVHDAIAHNRFDSPRYLALLDRYYSLHLCRLDVSSWPAWFNAEGEELDRNPVYRYLSGPSEFDYSGALASVDLTPQLRRLDMPTLVSCGEFDEAPEWIARKLAALLPRATLHVYPGLSHMPHMEDPAGVLRVTRAFLDSLA